MYIWYTNDFVTGIIRTLAEIKADLKAIKREVSAIRTLIVHKEQTTRTDSIQCQLPVSSNEQLHELETELQCQEQQNVLVCAFLLVI